MAELHHGPFRFELLITGTPKMLDRVREITALPAPGNRGHFSFDRIIPRPLCIEGTADMRAEFAERFHNEVVPVWENLLNDFGADASFHRRKMAELLDPACGSLWKLGFESDMDIRSWMRESWGTSVNVAPPEEQDKGSTEEWIGNRIHASMTMRGADTDPPLLVFDALARMLPGVKIALAWSSEDMHVFGEGSGLTTWRNGMRMQEARSDFNDSDSPYGQLRSLRPVRLARRISEAGFVESVCRPTVRWNLAAAELMALRAGETLTLQLGPKHQATVGTGEGVDFYAAPTDQITPADISDNHGAIKDDEVWHRLPGQVDGLDLALSLHSTEVQEANRRDAENTCGSDRGEQWRNAMWSP